MQELILTGGGSYMPAVRAAVEGMVSLPGSPIIRVSGPGKKTAVPGALQRALSGEAVRGGTALGGPSIFFEPKYY